MIPILRNHEHTDIIGTLVAIPNGLRVRMSEPVTREQFEAIFGNAGFHIVRQRFVDGSIVIDEAEIVEFSL